MFRAPSKGLGSPIRAEPPFKGLGSPDKGSEPPSKVLPPPIMVTAPQ